MCNERREGEGSVDIRSASLHLSAFHDILHLFQRCLFSPSWQPCLKAVAYHEPCTVRLTILLWYQGPARALRLARPIKLA